MIWVLWFFSQSYMSSSTVTCSTLTHKILLRCKPPPCWAVVSRVKSCSMAWSERTGKKDKKRKKKNNKKKDKRGKKKREKEGEKKERKWAVRADDCLVNFKTDCEPFKGSSYLLGKNMQERLSQYQESFQKILYAERSISAMFSSHELSNTVFLLLYKSVSQRERIPKRKSFWESVQDTHQEKHFASPIKLGGVYILKYEFMHTLKQWEVLTC